MGAPGPQGISGLPGERGKDVRQQNYNYKMYINTFLLLQFFALLVSAPYFCAVYILEKTVEKFKFKVVIHTMSYSLHL